MACLGVSCNFKVWEGGEGRSLKKIDVRFEWPVTREIRCTLNGAVISLRLGHSTLNITDYKPKLPLKSPLSQPQVTTPDSSSSKNRQETHALGILLH